MTETLILSPEARASVAELLRGKLDHIPTYASREGPPNLGEALPVITLGASDVISHHPIKRLRHHTPASDYWHVQVRFGRVPAMVTNVTERPSGWELVNLTGALLAQKVGDAITWIDRAIPEPGLASLIVIPDAYVIAIWIEQERRDLVVLVSGSAVHRPLKLRRAYSVHHFLAAVFGRYWGPC